MSENVTVTRVDKPWGYEIIWARTDQYVGKILHVNAGHALSVQYHVVKDETLYLLSGTVKLFIEEHGVMRDVGLAVGEAYHITPRTVHYMEAVTDVDILEASTPQLEDVVRLKDRYGRQGTSHA